MHMLHVVDPIAGDKRIQWEKDDSKDMAKAEKTFNEKIKEGWLAYGYKAGKTVAEQLHKFSKEFERIVIQPPVVGG